VVGHDPAIQETALMLAATAPDAAAAEPGTVSPGALKRMRAKFPTAAIAVLGFTGTWPDLAQGRAWLTTFMTPAISPPGVRRAGSASRFAENGPCGPPVPGRGAVLPAA